MKKICLISVLSLFTIVIFVSAAPLYSKTGANAQKNKKSQSAQDASTSQNANSAQTENLEQEIDYLNDTYDKELAPFLPNDTSTVDDDYSKFIVTRYSPMMNADIIAFYGHPRSKAMGIVGQYSLKDLEPKLIDFAKEYDDANGPERGVIPALYLIYGTCWPEGEIGIMSEALTTEYIEYAAERGWLVFLDHQIGKYSVEEATAKLLPYLRYPNVHLALDPEWRTTRPMKEIGSVSADEINTAQQMIEDYLIKNNLPVKRMLVIHQFKPWMISNRANVRSDFALVNLVHCADGFGNPYQKKSSYAANAEATNIPLKSFKLFSKPAIAGAGWDEPLMTPDEVLALEPRPVFIMIQ